MSWLMVQLQCLTGHNRRSITHVMENDGFTLLFGKGCFESEFDNPQEKWSIGHGEVDSNPILGHGLNGL